VTSDDLLEPDDELVWDDDWPEDNGRVDRRRLDDDPVHDEGGIAGVPLPPD